MKRLNILQVIPALGQQGGVERVAVEMAAFIVERGAGSYVAAANGPLTEQLARQGTVHLSLPLHRRNPVAIIANAVRLARHIRRHDIDLVHARSRGPAWSAYLACQWTGTPFIATFHGIYGQQNRLKHVYNSVMAKGRRTIACSEFIKQHIIEQYGVDEQNITVAAGGLDSARIAPEHVDPADVDRLRREWGCPPETAVLLSLGRITRLKGHAMLLSALAALGRRDWKLVIVGDAGKKRAYFDEIRQLVNQLKLDDHVIFAGAQDDVALYYAACDVAISSSIEPESFGRVAVEAQAMGRPVIATAHGGSLETIRHGETGLLVDPFDPAAMTAACERMLAWSPVERAEMGARGRRWVLEQFTIEQMCGAEFAAYEQLLGLSGKQSAAPAERAEAA